MLCFYIIVFLFDDSCFSMYVQCHANNVVPIAFLHFYILHSRILTQTAHCCLYVFYVKYQCGLCSEPVLAQNSIVIVTVKPCSTGGSTIIDLLEAHSTCDWDWDGKQAQTGTPQRIQSVCRVSVLPIFTQRVSMMIFNSVWLILKLLSLVTDTDPYHLSYHLFYHLFYHLSLITLIYLSLIITYHLSLITITDHLSLIAIESHMPCRMHESHLDTERGAQPEQQFKRLHCPDMTGSCVSSCHVTLWCSCGISSQGLSRAMFLVYIMNHGFLANFHGARIFC